METLSVRRVGASAAAIPTIPNMLKSRTEARMNEAYAAARWQSRDCAGNAPGSFRLSRPAHEFIDAAVTLPGR
jgi:hypothetical protein